MKQCIVAGVIMILLKCQLFAATVNITTAQTVALNFYKANAAGVNTHTSLNATLAYTMTDNDGINDFYVFDINANAGFVVVPATDNISPVIGYSTEGAFNPNIPEIGLKNWIAYASGNIRHARQNNTQVSTRAASLWSAYKQGLQPAAEKSTAVAPLLTTNWNQSPYYNALCPYDNANQGLCVTGCVATAMAQVMKYWNYPAHGTGSYTYVDSISKGFSENIGTLSANFGATTYQWSSMPNSISSSNTPIATLMYHCGVALAMNYSAYGSSAYLYYYNNPCVYTALKNFFGYDSLSMRNINLSTDTTGWINTIESELTAGRPVVYAGQDINNLGGHCWVCDGYNASNMFHMNWGWGGADNGYFSVANLDAGSYDFVLYQSVIIGIQPPAAPVAKFGVASPTSCNGIVQFADSSSGGPAGWLWNFGDGTTSTQQNPVHQYNTNGSYTVSLTISNAYGSNSKTISNIVTISRSAAPAVNNAGGCKAAAFSLSVNTSNPVTWYDSTGNLVSSANPFTTATLSKTTTYWAEAWNIDTTKHTAYTAGPASNTSSDGWLYYYYNTSNYLQLKFNVLVPVTLQSVSIYSGLNATRTIVCTNAAGTTIASKTLSVKSGSSQVTLNFNLPAGGPYYLGYTNDSLMEFSESGAAFPYSDANGAIQIAGNNQNNSSWYPYFYNWIVSEPAFCISQRAPVTATVGAASATIAAGGATTFCQGGSVTLTASGGATYSWSGGQTTQAITATAAGSYTVTVSSGASCSAVSSPAVVAVNASPVAIVTASGATTFCKGASVTLTAKAGAGYTYKWSTGSTAQNITVKSSGSYAATVTGSNGCTSSAAATKVTANALPNTTIAVKGSVCTGTETLTARKGTSNTFKWSTGQTTRSIKVSAAGDYIVTLTNANQCSASGSSNVNCTSQSEGSLANKTGTNAETAAISSGAENADFIATAYPNPYTGQFHLKVQSSNTTDNIHIKIFDINGSLLEENTSAPYNNNILLGNAYSAGVYLVQVQQTGSTKQLRVVKVE